MILSTIAFVGVKNITGEEVGGVDIVGYDVGGITGLWVTQ